MGLDNQTQVIKISNKHLYLLNHLAGSVCMFMFVCVCLSVCVPQHTKDKGKCKIQVNVSKREADRTEAGGRSRKENLSPFSVSSVAYARFHHDTTSREMVPRGANKRLLKILRNYHLL